MEGSPRIPATDTSPPATGEAPEWRPPAPEADAPTGEHHETSGVVEVGDAVVLGGLARAMNSVRIRRLTSTVKGIHEIEESMAVDRNTAQKRLKTGQSGAKPHANAESAAYHGQLRPITRRQERMDRKTAKKLHKNGALSVRKANHALTYGQTVGQRENRSDQRKREKVEAKMAGVSKKTTANIDYIKGVAEGQNPTARLNQWWLKGKQKRARKLGRKITI